jgi:hypothetical protein
MVVVLVYRGHNIFRHSLNTVATRRVRLSPLYSLKLICSVTKTDLSCLLYRLSQLAFSHAAAYY